MAGRRAGRTRAGGGVVLHDGLKTGLEHDFVGAIDVETYIGNTPRPVRTIRIAHGLVMAHRTGGVPES